MHIGEHAAKFLYC